MKLNRLFLIRLLVVALWIAFYVTSNGFGSDGVPKWIVAIGWGIGIWYSLPKIERSVSPRCEAYIAVGFGAIILMAAVFFQVFDNMILSFSLMVLFFSAAIYFRLGFRAVENRENRIENE